MPIISRVGARSRKVRLLYAAIFFLLIAGAVSMLYPFLLMLGGSLKSEADSLHPGAWPAYLDDDRELFRKYAESKYDVNLGSVEAHWWRPVGTWQQIDPPAAGGPGADPDLLRAFLDWRGQCPWWRLGHSRGGRMLPINGRLFRDQLYRRFGGDLDALGRAMEVSIHSWGALLPPTLTPGRYGHDDRPWDRAWHDFARTRPVEDRAIPDLDGEYWNASLLPRYSLTAGSVEPYNQAHGTHHASYREIRLERHAPPPGKAREDWEDYVRKELRLEFIRLPPALAAAFRRHLSPGHYADIAEYNAAHGSGYASFEQIPFPTSAPERAIEQADWDDFLRDRAACPAEAIEVYGPRQAFEEFVAARRGVPVERVAPLTLPIEAADYHDALAHAGELRWEFATRNYKNVLGYVVLHGRGLFNTALYCLLAVGTALIVNPLAAYALSRYKPPSTYAVLLFCMATMAFPGEVTMIPAFLLLKRFPLGELLGGGLALAASLWLLARLRPRWHEGPRLTLALGLAIVAGAYLVPALLGDTHVSLLNTFAALVLPGMANGFSIFLLKGFFDSLPRELYEAAEIDGAGEWAKFWIITMSLSKPILAVIALGAFTGAYSAFMMALIIIPDPRLWTLMVWLFQLQNTSHPSVVYASLVIAAVPTFLVFTLCQSLMMRGIVVPVEK